MIYRRLAIIAMSLFFGLVSVGCSSNTLGQKEDTKDHAYQMAKQFAVQPLMLPDQAKFTRNEDDYSVIIEGQTEEGYNRYRVVGRNLKAKNGYGVYVPYVYVYHIYFTGEVGENRRPIWVKTKGRTIPKLFLSPGAKESIRKAIEGN